MPYDLTELETKGFVVLKEFFSGPEIDFLLNDYQTKRSKIDIKIPIAISTVPELLNNKLTSLVQSINEKTNLKTDSIQNVVTYYDPSHVTWGWHQDREPYLLFQNSYRVLNIWFPLVKPKASESGISLIPMDELLNRMLLKHEKRFVSESVIGKGSQSFRVYGNKTTEVENDLSGERQRIRVDLNDLMVTPEVIPGDAIIFRYDVIHRTQVDSHDRIAAAIRVYSQEEMIDLQVIEAGISLTEKLFEKKKSDHRRLYLMKDLFLKHGADRLPLSMFSEILNNDSIR